MPSRRRELEDLLRTTRPQPPAHLEQRLAGAVPRLTRPTRVGRLRGAVAVALVILVAVAAGALGAFSRTADAGDRTIGVVRGAVGAPEKPTGTAAAPGSQSAGSQLPGGDGGASTPASQAPDAPTPDAPTPDTSASEASSADAATPDAAASTGDGGDSGRSAALRFLAAFSTYSVGQVVCHWGPDDNAYNQNNHDNPQSWDAIPITSLAVGQAHAGHVHDFVLPGGSTAASCADAAPAP